MFQNSENHPKVIFGVSFSEVGGDEGIFLDDLKGEFAAWDSIQISYTDNGKTKLKDYLYSTDGEIDETDGWYDGEYNYVGKTDRIGFGQGAWLVTENPTDLTTAGEVKKGHKIHTFTDPKTLVSSYYPTPFCPNAASVTWSNISAWDSIQVFYTDNGKTKLQDYLYSTEGEIDETDGWYDGEYNLLDADQEIAKAGEGFWLVLDSFEDAAFTEVSPLGDEVAK